MAEPNSDSAGVVILERSRFGAPGGEAQRRVIGRDSGHRVLDVAGRAVGDFYRSLQAWKHFPIEERA